MRRQIQGPTGGRLAVHFRSTTDLWETPGPLFRRLDREFRFGLDVCAVAENAKCGRFYSPAEDGLAQRWEGTCWMNPPYGRGIGQWVSKALAEARRDAVVVALVPARTDTRWWHEAVMAAAEIRLVRGRIRFGTAAHAAPFPSAVVVFRGGSGSGPPALSALDAS